MSRINLAALIPSMLSGMGVSLQIFGITLLLGLPLGLLLAAGRMSRLRALRYPVQAFLLVMRGTPLMLQLFFFYFGPFYIFGLRGMNRFAAVLIAFVLNYAAYFAEIYRGGIESISQGQYEAAEALGFTKKQTFFRIVLPQVLKRILPSMGNEFMTLVKDTALARVISVVELFDVAAKAANSSVSAVPFVVAAVFYLVMNLVVGQLFQLAER